MRSEEPVAHVEGDADVSLEGLDAVHTLLSRYWDVVEAALPLPVDGAWRALFDSAVGEISGNIVRHAYSDNPDSAAFHISFDCYSDGMEATMRDQGSPYVLMPAIGRPDMRDALDNIEIDHGWGLPIAQAASDGLEYNRLPDGHNQWVITKRWSS